MLWCLISLQLFYQPWTVNFGKVLRNWRHFLGHYIGCRKLFEDSSSFSSLIVINLDFISKVV